MEKKARRRGAPRMRRFRKSGASRGGAELGAERERERVKEGDEWGFVALGNRTLNSGLGLPREPGSQAQL
jgi:hypothetical protein